MYEEIAEEDLEQALMTSNRVYDSMHKNDYMASFTKSNGASFHLHNSSGNGDNLAAQIKLLTNKQSTSTDDRSSNPSLQNEEMVIT